MRWPWTSVARLDDAKEQITALRNEVAALRDALVRVRRHEAGLPEQPRQPRRELGPMPRELFEHIHQYMSKAVQRELKATAWKRYRAGESWELIMEDMMREDDGGGLPISLNGGDHGEG